MAVSFELTHERSLPREMACAFSHMPLRPSQVLA